MSLSTLNTGKDLVTNALSPEDRLNRLIAEKGIWGAAIELSTNQGSGAPSRKELIIRKAAADIRGKFGNVGL